MALTMTNCKHILEAMTPKPLKKISIATLQRRALANATKEGAALGVSRRGVMVTANMRQEDPRVAFSKWMSGKAVTGYFQVDNPINMTAEQAHEIRRAYMAAFDKAYAEQVVL